MKEATRGQRSWATLPDDQLPVRAETILIWRQFLATRHRDRALNQAEDRWRSVHVRAGHDLPGNRPFRLILDVLRSRRSEQGAWESMGMHQSNQSPAPRK